MKVLVINCGSSSLKYQLIDSDSEQEDAPSPDEDTPSGAIGLFYLQGENAAVYESPEYLARGGARERERHYVLRPCAGAQELNQPCAERLRLAGAGRRLYETTASHGAYCSIIGQSPPAGLRRRRRGT